MKTSENGAKRTVCSLRDGRCEDNISEGVTLLVLKLLPFGAVLLSL